MAGIQRRVFSSQSAVPSVALVTGAASGIGRAVCNILSQRGVNVVAADVNGEKAAETVSNLPANGTSHISHQVDVSQRESVAAVFHK